MMKYIYLALITCIISYGCNLSKRKSYRQLMSHIDVKNEKLKVLDSLTKTGVDTIIVYYKGCSGCFRGISKSYFVFWRKEKSVFVRRFDNYSTYKIIRLDFPFDYVIQNSNIFKNENLVEPMIAPSHGGFDKLEVYQNKDTISYSIDIWEARVNEDKIKKIIIDKIKATLWQMPEYNWVGQNYMYYPKGFDGNKKKWHNWEDKRLEEGIIKY